MKTPVFKKSDGGKLEISASALKLMLGFIQNTPEKLEAGGVMLGRHILGCTDIVVDEITVPMGSDQRTRLRFRRSRWSHQAAINRAWSSSRGTCVYLGEWHTHPEPNPKPSAIDLCDWKCRLWGDVVFADILHFVIVGICKIGLWEVSRCTASCVLLGTHAFVGKREGDGQEPV